jgi:superfamily II DNA or RNA helicase
MEKISIAWLLDSGIERPTVADLPIEQRIRLRQIALGAIRFNENDEIDFAPECESAKVNAALKIQARHPGEAILFFTDSAKFARMAAPRIGAALYIGDTPKKRRNELLDTFGTEGGPQYLLATYQTIAEGSDGLQRNCHIEVLFNSAESAVLNTQAKGRLNRTGQLADSIVRYTILARDTADDGHFDVAVAKMKARQSEVDRVRLIL